MCADKFALLDALSAETTQDDTAVMVAIGPGHPRTYAERHSTFDALLGAEVGGNATAGAGPGGQRPLEARHLFSTPAHHTQTSLVNSTARRLPQGLLAGLCSVFCLCQV